MKTIKYLRMTARISQARLAELMGTTQPRVADWENGKTGMQEARQRLALAALRDRVGDLYPKLALADLDQPWDQVARKW